MLSLKNGYRAVVFGASGGIGGALVRLMAEDSRCLTVHAGARTAPPPDTKIRPFSFDLADEKTISSALADIGHEGDIDIAICATGLLHDATLQPEKTYRALDPVILARSFAVNAVGPALIAKHVLPRLPRDRKSVFAALSARVGSISDNRSGGWHAYRASKAALNQLIRTCAIELGVRNKHALCISLHPGTVDTPMSGPFRAGVRPDRLFTPLLSATHLLSVIDRLEPYQSGGFFAWDGAEIAF